MSTRPDGGFFSLLRTLARRYPIIALRVTVLLIISGLAEGIGLVSLLPLLDLALGRSQEASGITEAILDILVAAGLRPSLGALMILIVIALSLKAGAFLLAMREAGYAGAHIASDLRKQLVRAVVGAEWAFFTKRPIGSLTNSVGIEAIRASQMCVELCYCLAGIVQVAIFFILVMLVSWQVTVGATLFGATLYFAMRSVVRAARTAGLRETELLQSLSSRLADGLAAIKPLKAMRREQTLQPLLEEETEELRHVQRKQAVARAIVPALQEPAIALVLGLGIVLALRYMRIEFQQLIFMALVFYRIATRIGNVQSFYQSTMILEGSYLAIVNTISEAEAAVEVTSGIAPPVLSDGIRFEQVDFTYLERPVLQGINLSIPAKKITTITGPSGAGKTTVVDLIVGLYQPSNGRVLVDGTPLRDIDLHLWRTGIGYVPQDTILLHDSIGTNVALDSDHPDRGEIIKALEAAGAWEFVTEMEEGLDTRVGERGLRLSGGQRQRIAIARALFRKPQVLILDEATAALDPVTEAAICSTLVRLRGRVTIVAVSHQDALARIADVHYVMRDGAVERRTLGSTHGSMEM